jgi:hypothetical protein
VRWWCRECLPFIIGLVSLIVQKEVSAGLGSFLKGFLYKLNFFKVHNRQTFYLQHTVFIVHHDGQDL